MGAVIGSGPARRSGGQDSKADGVTSSQPYRDSQLAERVISGLEKPVFRLETRANKKLNIINLCGFKRLIWVYDLRNFRPDQGNLF